MDTKRFLMALCIGAGACVLGGCATPAPHKVVLKTDQIYPPIGPCSQMIGYGNHIYVSGIIALNKAGTALEGATIEEQTRLVLEYIGAGLASHGLSYEDVLSSTVYMQDLNEFAAMNAVYAQYVKKGPAGARHDPDGAPAARPEDRLAIVAGRR